MTSDTIYCTILEELLADGEDRPTIRESVPEIIVTNSETYYDKIREISKSNKYTKWYINILM